MTRTVFAVATLLLASSIPSPREALAYDTSPCNIHLQDTFGLSLGQPTSAWGEITTPSPGYYHHCPGVGWQTVREHTGSPGGQWGALQLPPEDTLYWNCVTTNGSFPGGVIGHFNGSSCVAATDPNAIPRKFVSKACGQHLKVSTQGSLIRPTQIQVLSGSNLSVIYYAPADHTWWEWSNLTPGTWTLNPPAGSHGGDDAYVTCWNQSSSFSFDNLNITGTTD